MYPMVHWWVFAELARMVFSRSEEERIEHLPDAKLAAKRIQPKAKWERLVRKEDVVAACCAAAAA